MPRRVIMPNALGRSPMTGRDLAAEIRDAEGIYRDAHRDSERKRRMRNEIVREALALGWTHAQIAEATGLTRSRIGQIALH